MKKTCRAAVLKGVRDMEIQEFPIPKISEDDALLKVEMVGVCGTDTHMYQGSGSNVWPLIMGHEFVGTIEEIGAVKAQISGCKKGDRVVVESRFGCGVCEPCIRGKYNQCVHKLGYGFMVSCDTPPHLWGAYSEYVYLPKRAILHKISKDVPLKAAVLTCAVLGDSVRWLGHIGGVSLGDTVVILGAGQQGLGGIVAAKEAGAKTVIITGRNKDKERFKMAEKLGADHIINIEKEDEAAAVKRITDGEMADIAFDCSGSTAAMAKSTELVKKGGVIATPGMYGGKKTPIDFDTVVFNEIQIRGAHTHNLASVKAAIDIINSRKYPLEELVTHVYGLSQAELAVQAAGYEIEGEFPIKVAIDPSK
ncbi:zinc-binding dehydrogenase [Eubacteriales bacterium DFI.9.88]|nr:zinc-binding dehydrogenase [Eubacteriales bacterium DFI.9.88]